VSYALDEVLARLVRRVPRRGDPRALAQAAVAVLLREGGDGAEVLIVRRAERADDPWSGHFGLPGGRRDADDPDLLATARRETREEIGVELGGASPIDGLDDHVPQRPHSPRLLVRPFAFVFGAGPRLVLSPELTGAAWIPLANLARAPAEIEIDWLGERRRLPAWSLPGGAVWGMTYRILEPLVAPAAGA
jgi:8-oxo-dGTP pyrophosphatase MutT (NUDIX family)